MPLTLQDYDKLLTDAGVEPLNPAPKASAGTGANGTMGFYAPQVDSSLPADRYVAEYMKQSMQTAAQRVAGGTVPGLREVEEQSQFSKGVGRGVDATQALLAGGGAVLADLVGIVPAREALFEIYLEQMTEADQYQPAVHGVEGINSFSTFVDWAAFATGEQVPTILSMVASGGAGGLIGKLVAQRGLSASAGKLLQQRAGQLTQEAAERVILSRGINRGATAGVFTGSSTLGTGEVGGEQYDAGLGINAPVALGAGVAMGTLESIVPLGLAKMFGLNAPMATGLFARIRDAASRSNFLARGAAVGTAASVGEAATEGAQETIAIAARKFVDENYDELGAESRSRILNAVATGGLLGFLTGGGSGALSRPQPGPMDAAAAAEADILSLDDDSTSPPLGAPKEPPAKSSAFTAEQMDELIYHANLERLREQNPEEYERQSALAAERRIAQRETLTLEGVRHRRGNAQEAQADPAKTAPVTITMLTSDDVNPIRVADVPDSEFILPTVQEPTPEEQLTNTRIAELKKQRAQMKLAPESYTSRGKLKAEAQRALAQMDDAIAALEPTDESTSESLLTQSDVKDDLAKLSPGQRQVYHRLMDKIDDGLELTARETEMLDNLEGIIQDDAIELLHPEENQKTQLLRELEEAAQAEAELSQRELVQKKRIQRQVDNLVDLEDDGTTDTDTDDILPGTSTSPQPGDGGITVAEAQEGVTGVRLLDEGLVILLPNSRHIRDPRVKAALDKHDSQNVLTQALHIRNKDGTSYTLFLLDRIESPERLASLYTHEILVHHGLRTLPKKERQQIIELIKRYRRADMEAWAEARKIEITPKNEATVAEEVLAEMSEANDFERPLWNRLVAIVRSWIRKLLANSKILKDPLKLTDNDIAFILSGLQRRLRKAPPRVPPIPTIQALNNTLNLTQAQAVGVTTKFLQRFQEAAVQKQLHKGTLTQGQWRSLAKRFASSKEERELILSVLDGYTSNRISPSELEQAILDKLILFEHYDDPQAQFIDYASGGVLSDIFMRSPRNTWETDPQGEIVVPNFIVFTDARKDGAYTSKHYYNEPFYRGHIRGFSILENNGQRRAYWINIETQSDFTQTLSVARQSTPEQKKYDRAMLTLVKTYSKLMDHFIHSGNEEMYMNDEPSLSKFQEVRESVEAQFGVQFDNNDISQMFPRVLEGEPRTVNPLTAATLENRVNAALMLENTSIREANDQISASIYKRLIREDIKRVAKLGYSNYSLLHPALVADMEGWIPGGLVNGGAAAVDNFFKTHPGANKSNELLYNRYKKLYEWFKQEFGGIDEGIRLTELETKFSPAQPTDLPRRTLFLGSRKIKGDPRSTTEYYRRYIDDDIIALAGGRTQAGREGARLGLDPEMVAAVDKLSNPWMLKFRTTFSTMLQLAKQFNVKPLTDYVDRLTDWAAEKGGIISAADLLLKDTRKQLNKTEQAQLSRILFSFSAAVGDREGDKLTFAERRAIAKKAGVDWVENEADKTNIQLIQERYEQALDDVNREMQDAAMFQIMYRIIKRGKQFHPDAVEKVARDLVDKYNDTDAFTPQRADLVDEITLLAGPAGNQDVLDFVDDALKKLAHIKDQYEGMRGRNYFPYKRFGKWAVIVRSHKDNVEYNGKLIPTKGETVALWTFENQQDQQSWLDTDEMNDLHISGEFDVEAFRLTDIEQSHIDIPPGFLDSLKRILKGTPEGLSDAQELALEQYALQFTPGSKFVAHMMKRRGIAGMSEDMQRTFATYMQSAANHITRVNHASVMLELQDRAIEQLTNATKAVAGSQPVDLNGVSILRDDLKRHFNYIMEPGNELAWLRSLGFTWYLGFNVKSALVNFTQVPMVSYPYLASKFGASKAFAALTKAIPDSTAFARKNAKPVEPWLDKLIARGIRELFLDESLGVELAGAAQGDIMSRVLPANPATRAIHRVGHLASLPFQFTEKITRRMVFIAATRLHLEGITNPNQKQLEEAYIAGREAVRDTIFEYQKWNRPRFMRGKLSPIFLFWTFMQHMLVTLGGGYGKAQAARVFGMLFLAAGTMGLPLMENLLDLIDFGGTHAKKALGLKNPHVDSRLALRDLFKDAPGGADLWMYGFSSRAGLGPLHVLDLLGAPIPHVDVQGSVGLGRPVPGLEELTGRASSTEERFGRVALDILGPVAAIFYNGMHAIGSTDPDTWKRAERTLPAALRSISKATRIVSRGGEDFRRGGQVIDYDPGNMEHNLEAIAQFFGFTPTRLNDRYKLRAHQEDMRAFYMTWRQMLLEGYNYARHTNDREGVADAKAAIKRYNELAPDRRLRLTSQSLRRSRSAADERAALREEGEAFEKGLRQPFRDIKSLFPNAP